MVLYYSLLLLGLNPAGNLDTKFSLVMLVLPFCGGARLRGALKELEMTTGKTLLCSPPC